MPEIKLRYFSRDGRYAGCGSYQSTTDSHAEVMREIRNRWNGGYLPATGRFADVSVVAEYKTIGCGLTTHIVFIPDHWLAPEKATAEPPYTPTTNEVLDKATAITQQANTLCETLVCTALSLHGAIGFRKDDATTNQPQATIAFLKSAILSNLCLRQYTATGDELAIIQCLIPLFKDK